MTSSSLRVFTSEELLNYTGVDDTPIYIALSGIVYDVTPGKSFYGPGAGYHMFAGRDASRALATMKFEDIESHNVDDLEEESLQVLRDWIAKYESKYKVVGTLVHSNEGQEGA